MIDINIFNTDDYKIKDFYGIVCALPCIQNQLPEEEECPREKDRLSLELTFLDTFERFAAPRRHILGRN